MAVEKDDSISRAQANAASFAAQNAAAATPYNPMSGNMPDLPKPAPYNPMSGNMPDVPVAPESPTSGLSDQELSDLLGNADASIIDLYSNVYNETSTQSVTQAKQIADLQAQLTAAKNANAAQTTTSNQNALALLTATLQGYGLSGDIASGITGLIQKGYSSDTIQAVIQDPNAVNNPDPSIKSLATAWQTRFAANTARQKAGLPVLDPATYLATEQQYKSVMLRAGVPAAAISNDYIAKLMGVDVSPAEVQQRIDAATTAVNSEDPFVIQQLNQMGLGKGDLVFHLLDPNTASNIIQQKVQAAQVSAEAARQNVNISQDYAMQLAAQGVSQAQAQQGFINIAEQLPNTQSLASRYAYNLQPSAVGQALQAATFGTADAAAAQQELKRLQTQEISAFGGSAGASSQGQSLGIGNQQGVQ